jgi:hypothetical protein
MRAFTVLVVGFVVMVAAACDRDRGAEAPSGYGQPAYDQYGNPIGQPGQPGYNQPAYPPPGQGYGPPAPTPQTTPGQGPSQPSPLALPCQNDATCGTHKCNLQVGRCVFPCQNATTDCAAGLACVAGGCVPAVGP